MTEVARVLEMVCQPFQEHLKPTHPRATQEGIWFSVKRLSDQVNNTSRMFGENHINEFLEPTRKLSIFTDIDSILCRKWSQHDYSYLMEILSSLPYGKTITVPKSDLDPIASSRVNELRDQFFRSKTVEEIFEEYILPSSVHGNECLATLTQTELKIQSVFDATLNNRPETNKFWSPESLRQYRKGVLEAIFAYLLNYDELDQRGHIFARLTRALDEERKMRTDTEWGSFHHVLYGMATGTHDYHLPIWFNPRSHFAFLCIAKHGVGKLLSEYQDQREHHHSMA